MEFDFHSHSTASDGLLAPRELALRAAANGVDCWALTDHDVLEGLDEARGAAAAAGIEFVDGIEISVTWRGQTLHIVGLGIDPQDATLRNGLAGVRADRRHRAERIAKELAHEGIPDALAGAYRHAESPAMIGRTHFARYIVELGIVRDVGAVFRRFLAPGKPGYVAHSWAALEDAVGWIRAARGVAVIAHPGRYGLSSGAMDALVAEFKAAGGVGIEVVTGSHSPDQFIHFAGIARHHGLAASRGADFHGIEESKYDLGGTPALPADLDTVLPLVRARAGPTARAAV